MPALIAGPLQATVTCDQNENIVPTCLNNFCLLSTRTGRRVLLKNSLATISRVGRSPAGSLLRFTAFASDALPLRVP